MYNLIIIILFNNLGLNNLGTLKNLEKKGLCQSQDIGRC